MARKLYMLKAEILMQQLVYTYYAEHGTLPVNMSVLKSAMTRAFNTTQADIYLKIVPKLDKTKGRGKVNAYNMEKHPDYAQALSDVMAEYSEVND